jgi:hypothetical protein
MLLLGFFFQVRTPNITAYTLDRRQVGLPHSVVSWPNGWPDIINGESNV